MACALCKLIVVFLLSTAHTYRAFRVTATNHIVETHTQTENRVQGPTCCCATRTKAQCDASKHLYHISTGWCCVVKQNGCPLVSWLSTQDTMGPCIAPTANAEVADWSSKDWMNALYFSFSRQSSVFRDPLRPDVLWKLGLALPVDARIMGVSGGDCTYTRTLLRHVKAAGATRATVTCSEFDPVDRNFPSNVTQVRLNNSNTHDTVKHLATFAREREHEGQYNIIVANYNTCACYGSTSCAAVHLHNDESDVSGLHQYLANLDRLAHPTKSVILVAPVSFHDYTTGKRLITAESFLQHGWVIESSTKREDPTFGWNFVKWRWTDRSVNRPKPGRLLNMLH